MILTYSIKKKKKKKKKKKTEQSNMKDNNVYTLGKEYLKIFNKVSFYL